MRTNQRQPITWNDFRSTHASPDTIDQPTRDPGWYLVTWELDDGTLIVDKALFLQDKWFLSGLLAKETELVERYPLAWNNMPEACSRE